MRIVAKKHPEYRLVVFGEGSGKKELEKLVKELALEENVEFAGKIPNSEVPQAYASADIVVHSFAFKATTSIALLESMASGKAIVATDSGEVKKSTKGTAMLVEPKSPESIAQGIIKLIENPALRKEFGEKARKRAEEKYSIKAIAERFNELYEEIKKKRLKEHWKEKSQEKRSL